MKLSKYLKTLTPTQRETLAKRAKTTLAYLQQLSGGHRAAGPQLARRLEEASGGLVTRHDLRPDIFDQQVQ